MEIVLEIEPQKATQFVKRHAVISQCFQDGTLVLEARDALKPAQVLLKKHDVFPWISFFKRLKVAWWLSNSTAIPYAFRLQKRLPEDLLLKMDKLSPKDLLHVFATLRQEGFFPPLPKSYIGE